MESDQGWLESYDPESASVSIGMETQSIRQRQPLFTDTAIFESPVLTEAEPLKKQNRIVQKQTPGERWEEFSNSRTWKTIRPFLRPIPIIGVLSIILVLHMLTDFVIVQDGEAYSPNTKCQKPLILFKDSALRGHTPVRSVGMDNPNYAAVNDLLATSMCYLQTYAKNMSCITPLAYGVNMRIISMRRKNGDIIHLINPRDPRKEEKDVSIPETSTLFPNMHPIMVTRPKTITINHNSFDSVKTETFEMGDAFCVRSSLDLFDHKIPQAFIEGKQESPKH